MIVKFRMQSEYFFAFFEFKFLVVHELELRSCEGYSFIVFQFLGI